MKKYYYSDGRNQLGPFDIDELKGKNISQGTLVWYEGLHEWKQAGTLDELKQLFSTQGSPPIIKTNASQSPPMPNEKKYNWKKIGAIIAGSFITLLIMANYLRTDEMFIVLIIAGGLYLIYLLFKKVGGLKFYSIISIVISLVGIGAGLWLTSQASQAGENIDLGTAISYTGGTFIIFNIYFLAYSINVLSLANKE